jgi:hypothetical protein
MTDGSRIFSESSAGCGTDPLPRNFCQAPRLRRDGRGQRNPQGSGVANCTKTITTKSPASLSSSGLWGGRLRPVRGKQTGAAAYFRMLKIGWHRGMPRTARIAPGGGGKQTGTAAYFRMLKIGWHRGMPRTARIAPGGIIYDVLNPGVGRSKLFRTRRGLDRLGESAAVRRGRGRHRSRMPAGRKSIRAPMASTGPLS